MQVYAPGPILGEADPVRVRSCRSSLIVGAVLAVAACGSPGTGDTGSVAQPEQPATTNAPTDPPPPTTSTTAQPTTSTTAPTTVPVTSTTVATTRPPDGHADGCRRLEDFGPDAGAWLIVNDGVMGGRSEGRGTIEDSTLSFSGTVVTAGGGFTSVRLRLDGSELDRTERVRARLRLDDRTYGFTFEDDQVVQGRRISHGADLPVPEDVDADGFAIVELPYSDLTPSIFGQAVTAGPFDPDTASEIGIIVNDGIDGDFRIDVDWIDVCA